MLKRIQGSILQTEEKAKHGEEILDGKQMMLSFNKNKLQL